MVKGRKPLATAVKEASGAFIHDPQRRNKTEPKPKLGWPEIPTPVKSDKIATKYWNEHCKYLDDLGVLAVSDQAVIAELCCALSLRDHLYKALQLDGTTLTNTQGNVYGNPAFQQHHNVSLRIKTLVAELGLTPSSRTRLHTPEKQEESPFETWLKSDN